MVETEVEVDDVHKPPKYRRQAVSNGLTTANDVRIYVLEKVLLVKITLVGHSRS